ncbi:phosphoglycerate dehydrogenase [Roseiconus lacunae]|uniref:D-3-phosphoglycerate dehydrogenase n=1 Tax=Roseiconus lacunae TaxID=2605694 RepID=A0ABT7PIT2_9BACT|nr:phosphoglycerate dehydrogenase [Roseiconus lacunae]MCD0458503.1 phosphoglycerate dehydrogenase [Roseiconus lacunae]MDM4016390.1 phosphoglycerate dehydrogenase [Roseiconus lacunae]WRQ52007.1 phosphoglycerate dehydrogenase [Stieleria sp. HD01]
MYKILTLNNISVKGLERLPREKYEISSDTSSPDAVMLRSFKMHDMEIPETVKAIGRAGAGVNNIPVDKMTKRGVPVFNAPGANANAVKELVLAGLLIATRNIYPAMKFAETLEGNDAEVSTAVESGKKNYVGSELHSKTLGVIGLGAIGIRVANAASALGMKVVGYDPLISVENAWKLSRNIQQAMSLDHLFSQCDAISVHVPLLDATKGLVSKERIAMMNDGAIVVNLARGGICDDDAVLAALESGKLSSYVIDFPTSKLLRHPNVIAFPHLGASTGEAEENCAVMVADQVRDFLEDGSIRNSVNFPEAVLPRGGSGSRVTIANANVPNMVGQISAILAKANLNIADLLNKSRGELAYTIIDLDGTIEESALNDLRGIEGVLSVRHLPLKK